MTKRSRLNSCYHAMLTRCYCKKHSEFSLYGGRGIRVCDEWNSREKVKSRACITKGFCSFREWALANGYADNLTIDRIDVNKGYSPDNCRWVTMRTQVNNRKCTRKITYKGETHTIKEWASISGINYHTLCCRVQRGWCSERIFNQKVRGHGEEVTYTS